MNHDYTHCANWRPDCPEDCFRGQLTRDLQNHKNKNKTVSWAKFYGTEDCALVTPGERKYSVSYTTIYTDVVMANSPVEAAEMTVVNCPFDIDGPACVIDIALDEEWEI